MKPLVQVTDPSYFKDLLKFHGHSIINDNKNETQFYIDYFQDYNYLIDTNRFFSRNPMGDIIDRTQTVKMPVNYHVADPWIEPDLNNQKNLDECFYNRVTEFNKKNTVINLFWSGGIDSTAIIAAFLRYNSNYSNLKIYYTVWSVKENPYFYLLLKKIKNLTLIDYAGDEYFKKLEGIGITGEPADELTASLDYSFYQKYGCEGLQKPWIDEFYNHLKNNDYIDFCVKWFKQSGIEISTILEARWWFYISTKYYAYSNYNLITNENFDNFYNTRDFTNYWAQNLNNLISKKGYHTYKQPIKDFVFSYDKNLIYKNEKTKKTSAHVTLFRNKKNILNNQRFIAVLQDGTKISTNNLPLFSEKEYRQKYENTLDYLFNKP